MMKDLMLTFGAELHPCAPLMRDVAVAMADERLPADGKATSPQDRLDATLEVLRQSAGEHALADTAATLGHFASMTIVVDASGHTSWLMTRIAPIVSCIVRLKARFGVLVMPVSLLIVGGLGAAICMLVARSA